GIAASVAPFRFGRIYGHYFDRVIPSGGEQVLKKSVDRYIKAIGAT
ncbi:MAG: MBL fold metallo-hydrolase, partial [Hyphomicrobiales bacterium]|nr:MBL fold metallo-hydrolase [Hyphomicrobiales bacterium]